MEVIPAIDIIGGRCVRLTEGDYARQKTYAEDPLAVARDFEAAGLRRLHLVDLDGARLGSPTNLAVLQRIASGTNLRIDFGGGIRTEDDLRRVFDAGASQATVGSIALRAPETLQRWFEAHGPGRFLLGADVRQGRIAISGWLEQTQVGILEFLSTWMARGVTEAFCTDVGCDGRMEGPSLDLYRSIRKAHPRLGLIASGGVSGLSDLEALRAIGCTGAIVGKAIYEGRITLEEIAHFAGGPASTC
jgi:phosphoribosylformimino-5-aminoimidazole carboxamide ribotide isomerase